MSRVSTTGSKKQGKRVDVFASHFPTRSPTSNSRFIRPYIDGDCSNVPARQRSYGGHYRHSDYTRSAKFEKPLQDADSEERGGGLGLSVLEKLEFKRMNRAGTTADDYAGTLNIAEAMREAYRTGMGLTKLQKTDEYAKYIKYFNYLKSKKKK